MILSVSKQLPAESLETIGPIELGSQVTITSSPSASAGDTIRLSPRRWFVLFAVFLFGTASFLTDELSSILNTMLELLELPLDKYIYYTLLFSNIPILTTMPTAWFVDRFGIRVTMYVATLLMLIRNTFRALLFNPDLPYWQEFKLIYWIVAGTTSVQILSIFFCIPLKVSENWFSKSERSLAWTVIISTAGIGSSLAAFIYPRFINSISDVKPLFYLNIIAALVSALAVILCISTSKPEYPPSERMILSAATTTTTLSCFKSIGRILRHKDMMIHLVCVAIYKGAYLAIITILQDILLNSNHNRIFIGNLMSISSIVSMVALISLSTFVHRLSNITLVCKLCLVSQVLLFTLNMLTFLYPSPEWLVLLSTILFQISASWASPNINNMSAHLATGNVSEATVSGFTTNLIIVFISISKIMLVALIKKSGNDRSDYTYSIYYTVSICLIATVVYLIFFKGKRMDTGKEVNKNDNM